MFYQANKLSPKLCSHLQENSLLTLHLDYKEYQETCTEQTFFFFLSSQLAENWKYQCLQNRDLYSCHLVRKCYLLMASKITNPSGYSSLVGTQWHPSCSHTTQLPPRPQMQPLPAHITHWGWKAPQHPGSCRNLARLFQLSLYLPAHSINKSKTQGIRVIF